MKIDWHKISEWLDKFFDGGWRRYFYWSSVTTMSVAMVIVYVLNPFRGEYAPSEFLTNLNVTLGVVTALAGLTAIERDRKRTQQVKLAKVKADTEVAVAKAENAET